MSAQALSRVIVIMSMLERRFDDEERCCKVRIGRVARGIRVALSTCMPYLCHVDLRVACLAALKNETPWIQGALSCKTVPRACGISHATRGNGPHFADYIKNYKM